MRNPLSARPPPQRHTGVATESLSHQPRRMTALLVFWLKQDRWIQVWCLSLVVVFLAVLARMLLQLRGTRRRAGTLADTLTSVALDSTDDRPLGRLQVAYDK